MSHDIWSRAFGVKLVRVPPRFKAILRRIDKFKRTLEQKITAPKKARCLAQAEEAVAAFPAATFKRPHGFTGGLIISLTSYPKRYSTLHKTIRSLLDQSIKTDAVILWLEKVMRLSFRRKYLSFSNMG